MRRVGRPRAAAPRRHASRSEPPCALGLACAGRAGCRIERLTSAALGSDRTAFDRQFDACFDRLYAAALQRTGRPREAEAITRAALFELVLGIGKVQEGEPVCLRARARSDARRPGSRDEGSTASG